MRRFVTAWTEFMNTELNHLTRTQGSSKQRKYAHIQIQSEFKRMEQQRKRERFRLLTFRKKLLDDKLRLKQKLLEQAKQQTTKLIPGQQSVAQMEQQVKELSANLGDIDKEMRQFDGQLSEVEKNLEFTESEYVLLEGIRKQIVDNSLMNIRYMTMHGFTLHPETQKAVENVHYLLEHNLPIPKYVSHSNTQRLYEVMPEIFQREIGELDESARRLLEEKKLVFLQKSDSLVRFYERKKIQPHDKTALMIEEIDNLWININHKLTRLLSKHEQAIMDIYDGKTRFRSPRHFYYECIDIDDEKQFTPEQWALKQDILQVEQWKRDYVEFEKVTNQAIDKEMHKLRIPLFVANHPKLLEFWKQRHEQIVASRMKLSDSPLLPRVEAKKVLEEKLREALAKELPQNFKLEGHLHNQRNKNEAYNFVLKVFTKVINEMPEDPEDSLLDMPKHERQKFRKLTPQMKRDLLESSPIKIRSEQRISLDQLTKMLDLNNKDPATYTLQFFSKFFGVDPKLLQNTLNYLSYPKLDDKGVMSIVRFISQST